MKTQAPHIRKQRSDFGQKSSKVKKDGTGLVAMLIFLGLLLLSFYFYYF